MPPGGRRRRYDNAPVIEWHIVILLVAGAILSATAFWQATVLAEEGSSLANQARFSEIRAAQARSAVDAQLAHDRQVVVRCNSAATRRDVALTEYSSRFDAGSLATLVEAEHTRIALEGLLVYEHTCADYRTDRALEYAAFAATGEIRDEDGEHLRERVALLGIGERVALVASVLFAAVLLAVTFADAAHNRRWVLRWLAVAWLLVAAGAGVGALGYVNVGRSPVAALLLVAGLAVLLAVIGAALRWPRRLPVTAWLMQRAGGVARRASDRFGAPAKDGLRWWAEIMGAATLVIFAMAVLGFSTSSINERIALGRADAYTVQARQGLDIGQEAALSVLSFASGLAELDARLAASAQDTAQADTGDAVSRAARDAMATDLWNAEQDSRETLLASSIDAAGAEHCLERDLLLPWANEAITGIADSADPQAAIPDLLLRSTRDDPDAIARLIRGSGLNASFCAARAGVAQLEADGWSQRGATFTIALVVLGLAGFLFASAADADRSSGPRRWLFASGLLGLGTGATIALVALASVPPSAPDDAVASGARSYATAAVAPDCASTRERAAEAAEQLPRLGAARVASANAAICADDSAWLLSTHVDDARWEAFADRLVEARQLGIESATVEGNLGWAYLVRGLAADEDGGRRGELFRLAEEHTSRGLALEPTSPYWCFNRALLTLVVDGATEAEGPYREALAALDGDADAAGPCAPVPFTDAGLRNWLRLVALADLELLAESEQAEAAGIRELLVASVDDADSVPTCTDSVRDADLDIQVYPVEVGLEFGDESTPGAAFAAVWYYRSDKEQPWNILVNPTTTTVTPGCHTALFDVFHVVPEGELRVDLYVDGELARQVTSENTWWTVDSPSASFKRVEMADLGVSAVVPAGWAMVSERPGVEVVYGGEGGQVAFRHAEGMSADGMATSLSGWVEALLAKWDVTGVPDDLVPTAPTSDHWYLDMLNTMVADPWEGVRLGAGQGQYLLAAADPSVADLFGDVDNPGCPGTARMTLVAAADAEVAETIWLSQHATSSAYGVPADEFGLSGAFSGPHFSVQYPAGWVATGCPAMFVAVEPDAQANVRIGRERTALDLATYVQSQIDLYRDPAQEFTNWNLETHRARSLPGGVPAEEIVFTWSSPDVDVRQTQVYTRIGDFAYFLTFTTVPENSQVFAPDLAFILENLVFEGAP